MTVAPFPFDRVPRISKADARAQSIVARWLAVAPSTTRLSALLGTSDIRARIVAASTDLDPHAAGCFVKVAGAELLVRGSSVAVRAFANKILGGPPELGAPRPLNVVEESIWCLVVATALEDLCVAGVVWPSSGNRTSPATTTPSTSKPTPSAATTARIGSGLSSPGASSSSSPSSSSSLSSTSPSFASHPRSIDPSVVELQLQAGQTACAIQLHVPSGLELRVRAGATTVPTWAQTAAIDVPVVVGRCAVARGDLGRLHARSLVTIEPVGRRRRALRGQTATLAAAELEILGGVVGLRCPQGAVVGEVTTGYLPRPTMSLPDDAHVELTVGLGTTRMTLRQVFELSIGQVVSLERPLAGPFEVRAAGKLVGKGELVDVDGELAVRIVSLGDQE